MNAANEPEAAWRVLMTEPARYIDAGRLAQCFGGALPASLCERMLSAPRLKERLSSLIAAHHQLPPAAAEDGFDAADRLVAVAAPQGLPVIARRAGAIFWSAAIANTVLAPEVSALQSALGDVLCSVAINHRELSGPEQSLPPFETLGERVTLDGWRCFAAWCDAVDPVIGARTRLKLPVLDGLDALPAAPFAKIGPAIIRRAASL
jgi:hypothetical protein